VEGSRPGESRVYNAAIWQHCLNFFVATKRMLRGNNHSITPNDAAGRTARLGVNRHHGRRSVLGGLRQSIREFNEFS